MTTQEMKYKKSPYALSIFCLIFVSLGGSYSTAMPASKIIPAQKSCKATVSDKTYSEFQRQKIKDFTVTGVQNGSVSAFENAADICFRRMKKAYTNEIKSHPSKSEQLGFIDTCANIKCES